MRHASEHRILKVKEEKSSLFTLQPVDGGNAPPTANNIQKKKRE